MRRRPTNAKLDFGGPLSFALAMLAAHAAGHAYESDNVPTMLGWLVLVAWLVLHPIEIKLEWERER